MSTTEQPSYLYPALPVVETEPEPERPSWYRRPWVRRTAVAAVVVALAGSTIGLIQRNGQLNDTVATKTTQVKTTQNRLDATKVSLANAKQETASVTAQKDKLSGETVTCVNGVQGFLTDLSSTLTSWSVGDFNTPAAGDTSWASTCHDARVDAGG